MQTVSSSLSDGLAGQPSQVREVASTLIRVAKDRDLPVLLVGHVTKDGSIAGPRLLEHLVDVVCQFEGDRQTALRFVRALKNRFGPTDEVGCFEMTGDGIAEVPDPSGLFLSRGTTPVSGTCVTVALEGRRALPVEVQALVVETTGAQPAPGHQRRRPLARGDAARGAREARRAIRCRDSDVYVSTVGGVRLIEPAADLAIALAIASAVRDAPDRPRRGRRSARSAWPARSGRCRRRKQRAAEAARLGFTDRIDARQRRPTRRRDWSALATAAAQRESAGRSIRV